MRVCVCVCVCVYVEEEQRILERRTHGKRRRTLLEQHDDLFKVELQQLLLQHAQNAHGHPKKPRLFLHKEDSPDARRELQVHVVAEESGEPFARE